MKSELEITVLIHCYDLPAGGFGERSDVRVGIQKGQEVIDDVPLVGSEVTFQAVLRVGSRATGEPNFLGPYAHGKPTERFLYLCWGERKEERWAPFGRAKISLMLLNWDRLNQAMDTGEPVALTVALTDCRGRPACGTVEVAVLEQRPRPAGTV